ncbi:hypothetical protein DFH08DRAFT_806833 [Mycena albidolilacea]|uniref:Uncharacterized protein n=1 Tax=Mycena albidolilacea TaxID=1033008 RepID=A0AAD7A761_9AGAR|nr:hypothetical protein DFH08DRAFT_806833 [Mycena albidolilacea]
MTGKSKSKPKNTSEKALDTQAPTASHASWKKKDKEATDIININIMTAARRNRLTPSHGLKAVNHLASTLEFCIKLFSDSIEDALTEGRKKLQEKESKINMFSKLAEGIFTNEATTSEKICTAYKQDVKYQFPIGIRQSISGDIILKKQYSKLIKGLYQTGGGLKPLEPKDQQSNLIEKIKELFSHWDELDSFWCELPTGGIDHGGRAKSLFCNTRSKGGNTSGMKDDAMCSPKWDVKALEHLSVPRGWLMSLTGEWKSEKKPKKEPAQPKLVKTSAKAGDKHTFDLSGLDNAHCQDMVDSACCADGHLALELECEKNKRHKLNFEADWLRMEHEDWQECTHHEEEHNNHLFGFISSIMLDHQYILEHNLTSNNSWSLVFQVFRVKWNSSRNQLLLPLSIQDPSGKNRQEYTHKPGKGEFSISWPSRGEGDGNDDKGAKDNSMRKRTIKRNTGLQWDKPPSKATWSWSHLPSHALVATQVDLHKLSNVNAATFKHTPTLTGDYSIYICWSCSYPPKLADSVNAGKPLLTIHFIVLHLFELLMKKEHIVIHINLYAGTLGTPPLGSRMKTALWKVNPYSDLAFGAKLGHNLGPWVIFCRTMWTLLWNYSRLWLFPIGWG